MNALHRRSHNEVHLLSKKHHGLKTKNVDTLRYIYLHRSTTER